MRKYFTLLLLLLAFSAKAQSAGRLIVKLRNTQNDSIKYSIINKFVYETRKNEFQNRKKDFNRILEFAKKNNDTLIIAHTLIEKSRILITNKKLNAALAILNTIELPHRKTYVTQKLKTQLFFQIGNVFYMNNKNKKALESYFKAYDIAKANHFSLELIKVNNNISVILEKQGQQEKALEHFKHNLSLGKLINSKKIINKSRINLSLTYYNIHKLDSARYYSKQLIDALQDGSDLRSSAYYMYAKSSMDVKPKDSIIAYLNKAIYNNDKNYYAYDLLSNIYEENNQIDEAVTYSLRSLKYARTSSDIKFIQKELLKLGRLLNSKNEHKKAYNYLRQSKVLNDSIRSVKGYNEITKAITIFDSQKKNIIIEKQESVLTATKHEVRMQRKILIGILFITLVVATFFVVKYNKQQFAHKITLASKTNAERNTIAKELHETVGEQLTYIISSIDNLLFNQNSTNDIIISEIKRIKEFATESISMFRDTLWVLSKTKITSDELLTRSNLFFERIKNNNKHIAFYNHTNYYYNRNINTRTTLIVFRMIQEIINNAVNHSNTKRIDIFFERDKSFSIIKIKDYGTGFNPQLETNNFGLKEIKRQIENLGGEIKIKINNGTEVILKIPVHAQG